jgi:beta-galactosidase GanA
MQSSRPSKTDGELVIDDQPIRALWAAVVYQSIADLNRAGYARLANHWIYSEREDVGSLRWICDSIDLDYHKLQMLAMTREGRRKVLKTMKP